MFTTIISWFIFLVILGFIAGTVCLIAYSVYMTMSAASTASAVLFLTGLFGTVFSLMAPVIFDGVIPANNWGIVICVSCWFVVMPASAVLSAWAIERE